MNNRTDEDNMIVMTKEMKGEIDKVLSYKSMSWFWLIHFSESWEGMIIIEKEDSGEKSIIRKNETPCRFK